MADDDDTLIRNCYDPPAQPVETMPKDEEFLAVLDDGGGAWLEFCAWSRKHEQFMPRHCMIDPTNWFYDCETRGTRLVGWWPAPKRKD